MSSIQYYFNNIDAHTFQRLINAILIARFGEFVRLTPLFGPDGGKDGETAAFNPYMEFEVENEKKATGGLFSPPQKGRYLFQVKHHRTVDTRPINARKAVISDFERELKENVLPRKGKERVNYFYLITNVPASGKAIEAEISS